MASMAAQIVCSSFAAPSISRQCSGLGGCRASPVAARGDFRCRLSSSENGSHFLRLESDSVDSALQIFRDESKGIVCYRTPTGEITCEGFDEGPHFQPTAENQIGFPLSQLLIARKGAEEPLVNGAGI